MKRVTVIVVAAMLTVVATAASAQPIGTFTWQTQPYCNVLTVTVVQHGGVYQLLGADNLCGAGTAPLTGTAVPTASGVAFGMTVALPTGRTGHLSAAITLAGLSGTWTDADGTSGPLTFAAATGGAPRPVPATAAVIGVSQLAPGIYGGSGVAATVARSDHLHDDRYYTEGETTALLAGKANVGEVLVSGPTVAVEEVSLAVSVTTSMAGRLDIRFNAAITTTCSPDNTSSRRHVITVDGVPVRSSVRHLFSGTNSLLGTLTGVTDAIVPAGLHNIGVGIECTGANTGTWFSVNLSPGVVVTVLR